MDLRRSVTTIEATLRDESAALRSGATSSRRAREDVRFAEIVGSVRLAGVEMNANEIATLLTSGLTPGGRPLAACNLVVDYAAASARVAAIGRTRAHRELLRVDEIVALHAIATRRSGDERPGEWRATTTPALRGGVVPPPAWLVPRDMAAFVERFASGSPAERPLLPWLADYYGRFARIAPFASANGRVARLSLNLILARLQYPPLVVLRRDGPRFAAALDRAAAGELWPLAHFFGRGLLESVRTLASARNQGDEPLVALRSIATPSERAALYKAAQRGRLRTVRRGTAMFTNKTWIDEYRSSRAAAGRPSPSLPRS